MRTKAYLLIFLIMGTAHGKVFNIDKLNLAASVKTEGVEALDQRARVFGMGLTFDLEDAISSDLKLFLNFFAYSKK